MFFFPSTLLVMVVVFTLKLLLIAFALSIFLYLETIGGPEILEEWFEPEEDLAVLPTMNLSSEDAARVFNMSSDLDDLLAPDEFRHHSHAMQPPYITFLQIVNVVAYLWASNFVQGLGRMVLTATFATWYQVKNKSSIPLVLIPESFFVMVRYHAGTVAYASSLASIVTMFCIIWKNGRDKLKEMRERPILIVSWLTVLFKFSFDALAMSAIHGHAFYKSAKESYVLLMKNPIQYLSINTISECVIFIGSLLVPFLSFLATVGYCLLIGEAARVHVKVTACFVVLITSFLMSLTFFMVFRAASNTMRFCYLEESKFNHESEMNLYEIQEDDPSVKDTLDPA